MMAARHIVPIFRRSMRCQLFTGQSRLLESSSGHPCCVSDAINRFISSEMRGNLNNSSGGIFCHPHLEWARCFGSRNQIYRHFSHAKGVPQNSSQSDKDQNEKSNSSKSQPNEYQDEIDQFQNLSTYQKIKAMYRDYWYVLVPVHLASSIVFFGVFYYAASSGVDIIAILESLHFSEKVINGLKDSSAGYIALAYALYKIFTPIRYTVTLGGTTWAIRFLKERGMIKPRRPMKEAKENMQNIISAMKLPEKERQKFLEEKGLHRIGKAVGHASSAVSNLSNKSSKKN